MLSPSLSLTQVCHKAPYPGPARHLTWRLSLALLLLGKLPPPCPLGIPPKLIPSVMCHEKGVKTWAVCKGLLGSLPRLLRHKAPWVLSISLASPKSWFTKLRTLLPYYKPCSCSDAKNTGLEPAERGGSSPGTIASCANHGRPLHFSGFISIQSRAVMAFQSTTAIPETAVLCLCRAFYWLGMFRHTNVCRCVTAVYGMQ